MALYLGSGPVAQAFLLAFTIPNMLRRIFAEGSFNKVFIPIFMGVKESKRDANELVTIVFFVFSYTEIVHLSIVLSLYPFDSAIIMYCNTASNSCFKIFVVLSILCSWPMILAHACVVVMKECLCC